MARRFADFESVAVCPELIEFIATGAFLKNKFDLMRRALNSWCGSRGRRSGIVGSRRSGGGGRAGRSGRFAAGKAFEIKGAGLLAFDRGDRHAHCGRSGNPSNSDPLKKMKWIGFESKSDIFVTMPT
jgi:hypothetical protein